MPSIKNAVKNTFKNPFFLKKLIIVLTLLITTSMFYYIDVNSNIRHGMNIWESLFRGDFFSFYSVNLEAKAVGLAVHEANYGVFLYFIIGIWQLPLFIIEKIVGGNILNYTIARIWGKSYLLVALCIAGKYLKKIAGNLGVAEKYLDYVVMFFMSSAITMFTLCNVGQTDIIGVMFSMIAFWYLFTEDNEKHFLNIKFLIFFTCAALCKDFALFIFIPVILYKEKNILKIAINSCLPLIVFFLIELPFKLIDQVGTNAKKLRLWIMLEKMMEHRINILGVDIPILLLTFVAICMVAYIMHAEQGNKGKRYMLFFGYVSILNLFLTMYTYPYWLIYVLPFMVLFFFINNDRVLEYWLLDCIAGCSIIVGFMVEFDFIFSDSFINVIGRNSEPGQGVINRLSELVQADYYYNMWTLSYAVFVVWALILAVLNCPLYFDRKKKDNSGEVGFSTEQLPCSFELLIWLRLVASFVLCMMPVILFFIQNILHSFQ